MKKTMFKTACFAIMLFIAGNTFAQDTKTAAPQKKQPTPLEDFPVVARLEEVATILLRRRELVFVMDFLQHLATKRRSRAGQPLDPAKPLIILSIDPREKLMNICS